MARHKNTNWSLLNSGLTYEQAQLAVLMDIRDELQELNQTLRCYRVRRLANDVNRIERRLQRHMPLKAKHKP